MKVLIPPWLLSRQRLEVIVVEDCHNMGVIIETDEQDRIHQMAFPLRRLKVLVLKKLPNLNSIYSGRLECNSLEEITVNDCPQLTRIPLTIPHTLKKISTPLGLFRIWHCATAEAGSIFMGLNVDQKALAPTHSPEFMHLQL
uniref:Disease resistance protein At4g27190-like leucine-rich repeats domain-containing protein n=1 Tax=Salix viminalis TaxID=40686 RepID=A0A6N2MGU3_SALVM